MIGPDHQAGITVRPFTAGVAHGVDTSFETEFVHLAAVFLGHAASSRQGAVIPEATICPEAQLVGRTLCHNGLE